MFEYRISGFRVPIKVDAFRLDEVESIRTLIVELEVYDSPIKRRMIVHRIGVTLRGLSLIEPNARVVGVSMGFLANGDRRVFVATHSSKEARDDLAFEELRRRSVLRDK